MKYSRLPKRVFNSPLILYANFKDGNHVNLIGPFEPYASGNKFAVANTSKMGASGMFKTYNEAKEFFVLMVDIVQSDNELREKGETGNLPYPNLTMENNKLIAEFMGNEFFENIGFTYPKPMFQKGRILPEHCKFHTSWDWLMSVVEKIEKIAVDEWKTPLFLVWIRNNNTIFDLKLTETTLSIAYPLVIEFINWYNKNKED